LECEAGSGTPLYLMMQKRWKHEVTKLSQNNPFLAVHVWELGTCSSWRMTGKKEGEFTDHKENM